MHPSRAALITATIGAALLLAALVLRVLSIGYTISTTGLVEPVPAERIPLYGNYAVVSDGTEILFQQGDPPAWYSMSAEGGVITPASSPNPLEPEEDIPFQISDGVAYTKGPTAFSLARISPARETVTESAISPDGQSLAFATRVDGSQRARLYVKHQKENLKWLGEEPGYHGINWSPDSSTLALLVPREGFDQLFKAGIHGETYQQLTADPTDKVLPRWSPDGNLIAYLALTASEKPTVEAGPAPTATPRYGSTILTFERVEVFVVRPDGSSPRKLAETTPVPVEQYWAPTGPLSSQGVPYELDWITTGEQNELAYSFAMPEEIPNKYLYAVSPEGDEPRRVYPPVMIEALDCPPAFAVEATTAAQLTLSNSALVPVDLPVVLRAQHLPFTIEDLLDFLTTRMLALLRREETGSLEDDGGTGSVLRETITLLPQERRTVDWPIQAEPGARTTRLSVVQDMENPFPITPRQCSAPNAYHGLPNLPFLVSTVWLVLLGMLLCVPRLLQLKNGRWWAFWAAVPFLFWMLALFETSIHIGG